MPSDAEADRDLAKVLDRASLLLKLAARQLFAGARKAAAQSVQEALELVERHQEAWN